MLDTADLPIVDLGTVECLNFILLHKEAYTLEATTDRPKITISRTAQSCFNEESEIVSVMCATSVGTIAIAMDVAAANRLFDIFAPIQDVEAVEQLPFEWRVIFALEQASTCTTFRNLPCEILTVFRPDNLPEGPDTLYGRLVLDDIPYGVSLSLQDGKIAELGKYLASPYGCHLQEMDNLNVQLQPSIHGPVVSVSEAYELNPGDVLMLPNCSADELGVSLQIGPQNGWLGRLDKQGNFSINGEG